MKFEIEITQRMDGCSYASATGASLTAAIEAAGRFDVINAIEKAFRNAEKNPGRHFFEEFTSIDGETLSYIIWRVYVRICK